MDCVKVEGLDESLKRCRKEIERIPSQLTPGYRFKNEEGLEAGQQDHIDGHLEEDGVLRFHSYEADPKEVCSAAKKIKESYGVDACNVVVVGNGGSISTSHAVYDALLRYGNSPRMHLVDTMDPDQISYVKCVSGEEDTVVVAISKSGTTRGVLDSIHQFIDYPLCAVTTSKEGRPLYDMISAAADWRTEDVVLDHPHIGGRYSGRTPACTLPLALSGFTEKMLREYDKGCKDMYEKVGPQVDAEENPALGLAANLYLLEGEGYGQIFAPMYSHRLDGFAHLITQLIHESSCKAGLGQSILAAAAPESQHHSNQRLFGGPRDMAALFFTLKPSIKGLKADDGTPLEDALGYEYMGTKQDVLDKGIPSFTVSVDEMTPYCAGALLGFSHYAFGVYPALLRDVNPVDQPQVVASKNISRKLRKH